jgi:hypothetical protein
MAASVRVTAFWDIVPCSLVEVDLCLEVVYCLRHQGRQYACMKLRSASRVHGAISEGHLLTKHKHSHLGGFHPPFWTPPQGKIFWVLDFSFWFGRMVSLSLPNLRFLRLLEMSSSGQTYRHSYLYIEIVKAW